LLTFHQFKGFAGISRIDECSPRKLTGHPSDSFFLIHRNMLVPSLFFKDGQRDTGKIRVLIHLGLKHSLKLFNMADSQSVLISSTKWMKHSFFGREVYRFTLLGQGVKGYGNKGYQ